jgi:hypothetical protein
MAHGLSPARITARSSSAKPSGRMNQRYRELRSGSIQDEAFGEAVRSRTPRWDLHGIDAGTGQDGVEGGGELAGAVADEEPEGGDTVVEVHQCCGPVVWSRLRRVAGRAKDVDVAAADLEGEEDVDPFLGDRAVDVEEVDGQHARGLRAQEPSPGRIRWTAAGPEVSAAA